MQQDLYRTVIFFHLAKEYWKHLRTTNVMESTFTALGLRTDAAKWCKKVANATAVTCKTLLIAGQGYRKFSAREKMKKVYLVIDTLDIRGLKQEALAVV